MREGVGRSNAAITVVNALGTGIGCAAGIELPAEAHLRLSPAQSGTRAQIHIASGNDTPLVRTSLSAGLRTYSDARSFDTYLSVDTRIPPARGLKSSSAVSCAILLAIAQAFGRSDGPLQVARLSAAVSQEIGLSATGAFDDAVAGMIGGFVVTDNRARVVLRNDPINPDWETVLLIPTRSHPPSVHLRRQFAAPGPEAQAAATAAVRGKYLEAMEYNTELVERVLSYPYRALRETLRRDGALAAGVSGMGPTLAAITPKNCVARVLSDLPGTRQEHLATSFAKRPTLESVSTL